MYNNISTDYTILAIENNMEFEKVYMESMIKILELEADYIDTCLEFGCITMEAVEKEEYEKTEKRNIFDRILDAISALFGAFTKKVTLLINRNDQWLKKNFININEEVFSKMGDVEIFPYWKNSLNERESSVQTILNGVISTSERNPKLYADPEKLNELIRKYIGGKDSIAEDCKNFFRTCKKNEIPKVQVFKGSDISKHVNTIKAYIKDYDKEVVPLTNKYMNNIKKLVKKAQAASDNVSESFCVLEGVSYSDTFIGSLPNMCIVTEATDLKVKGSDLYSAKSSGDGSDDDDTSGDDKSDKREGDTNISQYYKTLTNFLKIVHGAFLTVLEEIYLSFVNLCKKAIADSSTK